MKILQIHNYYQQPGGEDQVFAAETSFLRQHDHEVVEYVEDNKRIDKMSRLVAATNTIWSYSSRQKLHRVLCQSKPAVAHFHNTFMLISPSAYYACHEVGVPVVQTLHNYRLLCPTATFYRDGNICEDCLGKTPPWPGIIHTCYRKSRSQTTIVSTMLTIHRWLKTWQDQVDIYIALTDFARQKFIEGGLPREKIVIKPNFINPDPGLRECDGHYVLFVGRLSSEKGVQTLLKAWQCLRGIPLKIIGDGPLMEETQTFVEAKKLECVELLGWCAREEVLELMKEARFLVLPSECYESFAMTIAETFACGVPVIASQLGSIAEIVEDKHTGIHFTPGDSEDLAVKVEWAWKHEKEMINMGKEARREYEQKYTAERNYEMLIEIYKRAVKNKKDN